jgi:hypothetical protein
VAPLIGYYAHHHGRGHLNRARLLADAYPGPVTILSSSADPAVALRLPPDVGAPGDAGAEPSVDVAAKGALHWAPRHDPLLAPRARALLDWITEVRPALVVVDVSVEVAVQVRLAGVPVVVVRQHGDRTDPPHALAYRLAESLLAPYPAWCEDPTAAPEVRAATFHAGGFSRFDDRPRPTGPRDPDEVLVVAGTGGTRLDATTVARLAEHSELRWTVVGVEGPDRPGLRFLGRVEDPWPLLGRAGVVVTSAGHSALCEAAAAGAPTVAVVEDRPFAEQAHKVAVLGRAGAVQPAPPPDRPVRWDAVLRTTAALGPRWGSFVDGGGAARAAAHLAEVAVAVAPVRPVLRRAS